MPATAGVGHGVADPTTSVVLPKGVAKLGEGIGLLPRAAETRALPHLVHHRVDVLKLGQSTEARVALSPARTRLEPHRKGLGEVFTRVTLRVPIFEVHNEVRVAGTRRVTQTIGATKAAKTLAPARPTVQVVGVVDRVPGFVAKQAHPLGGARPLDLASHGALELHQPRVRQIEGKRKARYAVGREPIGRQPGEGSKAQTGAGELAKEADQVSRQRTRLDPEFEVAEPYVEQGFVVEGAPPGRSGDAARGLAMGGGGHQHGVSQGDSGVTAASTRGGKGIIDRIRDAEGGMQFDLKQTDSLLSTTRAVRKRLDLERPVERAVLLECLQLATQAPTGSNRQAWRWLVVTDPDKRAALADLYRRGGEDYLRGALKGAEAGTQDHRVFESANYLLDHLHEVPVHVVPCVEGAPPRESPAYEAGFWGSICPAIWSFQLALRSRGLGSVWTTLHLVFADEAAKVLEIPAGVTQAALIPVAYTVGADFKAAARPPVAEITHWERWSG